MSNPTNQPIPTNKPSTHQFVTWRFEHEWVPYSVEIPRGATHFVLQSVVSFWLPCCNPEDFHTHEIWPRFSLPIHDRDLYAEASELSFVAMLYGVTAAAFNASMQSLGLDPETAVFADAFGVAESRVQVSRGTSTPVPRIRTPYPLTRTPHPVPRTPYPVPRTPYPVPRTPIRSPTPFSTPILTPIHTRRSPLFFVLYFSSVCNQFCV
jgi:hypothetical protein